VFGWKWYKGWGRRRRNFTRHPITGLNFKKTISKPYYNQAILKKPWTIKNADSETIPSEKTEVSSLIKNKSRTSYIAYTDEVQSNDYKAEPHNLQKEIQNNHFSLAHLSQINFLSKNWNSQKVDSIK
jgi:archaellum component FlaG (FlaF/FlaG flagellin family)